MPFSPSSGISRATSSGYDWDFTDYQLAKFGLVASNAGPWKETLILSLFFPPGKVVFVPPQKSFKQKKNHKGREMVVNTTDVIPGERKVY